MDNQKDGTFFAYGTRVQIFPSGKFGTVVVAGDSSVRVRLDEATTEKDFRDGYAPQTIVISVKFIKRAESDS